MIQKRVLLRILSGLYVIGGFASVLTGRLQVVSAARDTSHGKAP